MLGVFAPLALLCCFHCAPTWAAACASWLVGCASASSGRLHAARRVRDLDPELGFTHCRDGGFQIAGLNSSWCYCGRRLSALIVSTECFNTSSHGGSKDVRGERKGQSVINLPVGRGWNVWLYRTEGPFLHSIRLSASPDRVHAGETVVLEVSGKLAGSPNRPTGIVPPKGQNLSSVTVEILGTSSGGQSSHRVDVLDDGSFTLITDWIVETPGTFLFVKSISKKDASVLQGPLGVPSCIPFLRASSHSGAVRAAYVGDPFTLQAFLALGSAPERIHCWFKRKGEKEEGDETTGVWMLGLSKCRNSKLVWTFKSEGVHIELVKGSSVSGWILKTHNIAVVSPAVSDPRKSARPSGKLPSVVTTRVSCCVTEVICASGTGDDVTAEGRKAGASLPTACPDDVTATASNRVTQASLRTLISARNPVAFGVAAGSEVTALARGTTLCRDYDSSAGEEVVAGAGPRVCVEGELAVKPTRARQRPARQLPESTERVTEHTEDDGKMSVRIHAASRAYPTNTDVTFLAVTDAPDPLEFLWHFGDAASARTTSRTATKRYRAPGSYDVVVVMSAGGTSIASPVFPLVVQRAVRLNRLVHRASVLRNQTVTVSCRVNTGTDVNFLWSFGDGTIKSGQSTEQHVFHRVGEVRVELTAFNLISSASLSSSIFVVDRVCQPPPVKNMGPLKLQVRRHEKIHLGVTYDADVDCDLSRGLRYTWTLFDSEGGRVPLSGADPHRQSLMLPGHCLRYDTYTATAKVEVVGSVVYSNYSVRVQVVPSPPVASIKGGTNFFINRKNITMVTLAGRSSYNPDFPSNPVSFRWTCEPLSAISSSCFDRHVPVSSPELTFPFSVLKSSFDQFRFRLSVQSGEGTASAEAFVTVTSSVISKVALNCTRCHGDQVIWDQPFSIGASCEECAVSPEHVSYTWRLYLVNASSKPLTEIPFCHTVDLSSPSSIAESPHSPADTSTSVSLLEDDYELRRRRHTTGEELSYHPRGALDGEEPLHSPSERPPLALEDGSIHFSSDFAIDPDSSADGEFSLPMLESVDMGDRPDYDVPFPIAEEGDPGISAGRPSGADGETLGPGLDSDVHLAPPVNEGSNLLGSSLAVVVQEPTLLDLPRELVERQLFESYTYTGISSHEIEFKAFSLQPGSRYMLEATAEFQNRLIGRTQLFLKTKPAPTGMTCQVQPVKGVELYTHFSIFCTSGREDLVYEYSFSVGNRPPRVLYEGNNFQYYFSLPSGHHSDDYKVTINTKIRSSMYGTSTKHCAVSVEVLPSFSRDASSPNPDLELSNLALKNLSLLVRLGNDAEVRNQISLLSGILNRLSSDAEGDACAQIRIRSALICTVCQLESTEQAAWIDRINILKELLEMTNQVTLASVKRVAAHVRVISEHLFGSSAAFRYRLDNKALSSLVSVLSYCLQTAGLGPVKTPNADMMHEWKSNRPERIINESLNSCMYDSSNDASMGTSVSAQQVVADILQTASHLLLRSTLLLGAQHHSVSSNLMSLHAAPLNRTSAVISSSSATFYIPSSLIQRVLRAAQGGEAECVMSLVTELTHCPYPGEMRGPLVDLSLYKCSTKRKILVPYLLQPIITELHQPSTRQRSLGHPYVLHRSCINYHSFNITQEHLQQAVQLCVEFTHPPRKTFPVMLLYRMFEKPTPSMHHLHRVHHWGSSQTCINLPPFYLNAAGVGYLALLDANFGKPLRRHQLSIQVNYSLAVSSSQCLSWDHQQGAWTHLGCRTQQGHTTPSVNCSCLHLRPLTLEQQQIESSYSAENVDQFISASGNVSVLAVLAVCVCLFIPGLVVCRRADVTSEESRRVHNLTNNSPWDPYHYAVTVHTGFHSAASMSAKIYIVLYGDDGVSQTRELQVPGCSLFKRNSQDTFILSAAESLGQLWGVHIWHDNSGPSPDWNLKLVEVSELNRAHVRGRTWLFVAQCWLAASKGDGQVERMLRACTEGIGFAKMLHLKLSDYLADFHTWLSVCSRPRPHSFTHTQRLGVCVLLLSAYACLNAAVISQMDEPLPFEMGIVALSAVSVTTGALSVLAGLPAAGLISLLFRLREVKLMRSESQRTDCFEDANTLNDSVSEAHLSWNNVQQEAWKKEQSMSHLSESTWEDFDKAVNYINADISKENEGSQRKDPERLYKSEAQSRCGSLAWALCLLLSFSCLLLAALLGLRFSSGKALLWMHSLFCSLLMCMFLIQPAVILAVAVIVSFWYRKAADFHSFSRLTEIEAHTTKSGVWLCSALPQGRCSNLEKLLVTRRRARYLRLVCPPSPAELRLARGRRRRETLAHKTLRDLAVCVSMLLLMLCVSSGYSSRDHYHLSKAVKQQFIQGENDMFMSIKTYEDWWRCTHNLLKQMYKNQSDGTQQSHVLIGEPILWKTEISSSFYHQVSFVSLFNGGAASTYPRSDVSVPMATPQRSPGYLRRHSATVGLGHTKSDAAIKLRVLRSNGWLSRETVTLKVQFTLFSPLPNLFATVSLFAEQSPVGTLQPSATVQPVTVFHRLSVWDYVVMVCQLLFLLLSLLHLCLQIHTAAQQGLMGYFICSWLDVILPAVTLVYYFYYIYHSSAITEVMELLQEHSFRGHEDISQLADTQQHMRSLRGVMLFLLTVRCVSVLRGSGTTTPPTASFTRWRSGLSIPTISGLILLAAFGSLQTLDLGVDFLHRRVRYLPPAAIWTALMIGYGSSVLRKARRSPCAKESCTLTELSSYLRRRVCGQHGAAPADAQRTYYLEEFESLLDELLFKLNALSDSLHHTLPPKVQYNHHREDSPPVSPVLREPACTHTQSCENALLLKVHKDIDPKETPATHLLRVQEQRGQRKDASSSECAASSDILEQIAAKAGANGGNGNECFIEVWKSEHLRRGQSASQSVPDEVREMQRNPWAVMGSLLSKYDRCGTEELTTTQTAEVLVEVLIHEEPRSPGQT